MTKKKTILAVDGSFTALRVTEGVLLEAGYEVLTAASAEVALSTDADLVLLATSTPEIDDRSVADAIANYLGAENIPLILVTDREPGVSERYAYHLNAVDRIARPFPPQVLLALVEHVLSSDGRPKTGRRRVLPDLSPQEQLAVALATECGQPQMTDAIEASLGKEEISNLLVSAAVASEEASVLCGAASVVPIAAVIQLLAGQRATGVLRVEDHGPRVDLVFREGLVAGGSGSGLAQEFLLGNILVRSGVVTDDEMTTLLGNRQGSQRMLGSQLVKLGYLQEDQLCKALADQVSEMVYELLRWPAAHYVFRPGLPAQESATELNLNVEGLLMEGYRRIDEWGVIEGTIGSFKTVLVPMPGGEVHTGPSGLTPEEMHVLAAVDGIRSVQQVIDAVGLGTFDVCRVLYRLLTTRVVQPKAKEAC